MHDKQYWKISTILFFPTKRIKYKSWYMYVKRHIFEPAFESWWPISGYHIAFLDPAPDPTSCLSCPWEHWPGHRQLRPVTHSQSLLLVFTCLAQSFWAFASGWDISICVSFFLFLTFIPQDKQVILILKSKCYYLQRSWFVLLCILSEMIILLAMFRRYEHYWLKNFKARKII